MTLDSGEPEDQESSGVRFCTTVSDATHCHLWRCVASETSTVLVARTSSVLHLPPSCGSCSVAGPPSQGQGSCNRCGSAPRAAGAALHQGSSSHLTRGRSERSEDRPYNLVTICYTTTTALSALQLLWFFCTISPTFSSLCCLQHKKIREVSGRLWWWW